MYGGYSGRYSRVPISEDGEKLDPSLPRVQGDGGMRTVLSNVYLLLLHVLVILSVGSMLVQQSDDRVALASGTLLPAELPCASESVHYEVRTFAPGGFTDHPELQSEYFGPPSPERDQLWESLYDVGIAVISKQENDELSGISTTPVVDEEARLSSSEYIVTLEVFHQLHCLDYVRHASYATAAGHAHHQDESVWSKTLHINHCIDYLRQVIQCHGDLTPIMMEHIPGRPKLPFPNLVPYKPNFEIQHTCRNWDAVYDFALQRNTSGFRVA